MCYIETNGIEGETYISTRSTLIPHVSVASSKETWHSVLVQIFKHPCTCLRVRVLRVFSLDSKFIPVYLHVPGDCFALAEYLVERPGSHHVTKGSLSQQFGAVMSILNVRDSNRRVVHAIVHYRIHRHRHTVLRQHLISRKFPPVNSSFLCVEESVLPLGAARRTFVCVDRPERNYPRKAEWKRCLEVITPNSNLSI